MGPEAYMAMSLSGTIVFGLLLRILFPSSIDTALFGMAMLLMFLLSMGFVQGTLCLSSVCS